MIFIEVNQYVMTICQLEWYYLVLGVGRVCKVLGKHPISFVVPKTSHPVLGNRPVVEPERCQPITLSKPSSRVVFPLL